MSSARAASEKPVPILQTDWYSFSLVVAGEQVGAEHAGPLALAVVRADGHEVARVGHALQVVLLDLEPREGGEPSFAEVLPETGPRWTLSHERERLDGSYVASLCSVLTISPSQLPLMACCSQSAIASSSVGSLALAKSNSAGSTRKEAWSGQRVSACDEYRR